MLSPIATDYAPLAGTHTRQDFSKPTDFATGPEVVYHLLQLSGGTKWYTT